MSFLSTPMAVSGGRTHRKAIVPEIRSLFSRPTCLQTQVLYLTLVQIAAATPVNAMLYGVCCVLKESSWGWRDGPTVKRS